MKNEFSDGCAEMSFAEQYHSLQALRFHGLDKAFGKRIQVRAPRRENHGRDAAVAQQTSKG
jgi:hypothetical protein